MTAVSPSLLTREIKLLSEALKLKRSFLQGASRAAEIANKIDHDQKWAWARNMKNQGILVKAMDDLKANLSTYGRMFVTEDVADWKTKAGADHFNVELGHFLNVQPLLTSCSRSKRNL